MTRGVRALVGVPKVVRVWRTCAVQTLLAVQAPPPGLTCTTPKVIAPSMSLKLARLKRLYISQRSCIPLSSPTRMFLKKAKSVLKIEGIRTALRGRFPICPSAVGAAKHAVLMTKGVPVGSAPPPPFIGSRRTVGRAWTAPPVKSVIIVQTVAEVWNVPGGQVCPELTVAVPEV